MGDRRESLAPYRTTSRPHIHNGPKGGKRVQSHEGVGTTRYPETVPATTEEPQEGHRTPGIEPRLLTLEDVATYLNVRVAQVYALVRSGDLPAVKIGGRGVWRVDRAQLDSYIDRLHEDTEARTRNHRLDPR